VSNCPCLALDPDGPEKEEVICCNQAAALDRDAITVRHGRMATNGELRFRLKCSDGTAYIRTQTTGQSQGWQKPHFHQFSRETYIVERGWIGYAELNRGRLLQRMYAAGQTFTTEPGVVHNIYMPADAVIHTVKHGLGGCGPNKSDWWGEAVSAEARDLAVKHGPAWTGPTPLAPQPQGDQTMTATSMQPGQRYDEAYRHFDNLIWQVPAWSSGLFAVVVASVNALLTQTPDQQGGKTTVSTVAQLFGMSTNQFAGAQLAVFGLFTLVLAYALHRFRWHQASVKTWPITQATPKVSPQTLLQGVTLVEAGIQLLVAGVLFGLSVWPTLFCLAVTLLGASVWSERQLRKQHAKWVTPCRRASDQARPVVDQGAS